MSDEGIERSFNLAGSLGGGGIAKASVAKGGLDPEFGIFAGPGAKNADLRALEHAKTKADMGVDPNEIRQSTGWFQGPDGKWRFEIDDSAAIFHENSGSRFMDANLEHPELYEAYPGLKNTILERTSKPGSGWSRQPGPGEPQGRISIAPDKELTDKGWTMADTTTPMNEPMSVLLHELQHQIQAREGFTGGSSPEFVYNQLGEFATKEARSSPEQFDAMGKLLTAFNAMPEGVKTGMLYRLYRRNAGEAEANAVQMRRDLSRSERRLFDPLDDMRASAFDKEFIIPKRDINEY
jgi:hypothetical protein